MLANSKQKHPSLFQSQQCQIGRGAVCTCLQLVCVWRDRLVAQGEALLVKWGQEQSQAALQGLHTARQALQDLQAQSQKQRQNQNAKRCALCFLYLPFSGR